MPESFIISDVKEYSGDFKQIITREGVYSVIHETSSGFAVKEFIYNLNSTTIRDVAILQYFDNPNVIKPIGVQLEPAYLAMPLAQGTLDDLNLNQLELRKWVFYQIFRGLAYCHSKDVWHLDIKPANILIFQDPNTSQQIIKITDFGISEVYARSGGNSTDVFTLYWRAPELLLGDRQYTESVDIWGVGVMLLNAITNNATQKGGILYADSDSDQMFNIFRLVGIPTCAEWFEVEKLPEWNYYKLSALPKWKSTLQSTVQGKNQSNQDEFDFLTKLLAWPNKRITALDALKHPYFDSVREEIEFLLPAPIESRVELILQKQNWIDKNLRKDLFEHILKSFYRHGVKLRTICFAFMLFDIYVGLINPTKEIEKIGYATLLLAGDMYEDLFDDEPFTSEESQVIKQQIISKLDFNLVIPTFNDFIFKYVKGENITQKQYKTINMVSIALMLNYDYTTKYTQTQLAQITIETVKLKPQCLRDKSPLLDNDIIQYLVDSIKLIKINYDKYQENLII